MKKFIVTLVASLSILAVLSGCNRQLVDTTYSFNKAVVCLPDGTIIYGEVDSWKDYDGDQIQVKIDGVTYLTHATNVVLINE